MILRLMILLLIPALVHAGEAAKTRWVVKLKNETPFKRHPTQYAQPLIVDQVIYVGSASRQVFAINRSRGQKIWKTKVRGPVYGGIAFQDNVVYVGDGKGYVYALDAEKGSEKWNVEVGSDIMSTPLVVGNTVYVTTMSGQLVAVDRSTGARLFQTPKRPSNGQFTVRGASSPVLWKNSIIAGFSDGSVVAFDLASGQSLWEHQLGNISQPLQDVDTTPTLMGDSIIVGCVDGHLYSLSAATGAVQWMAPIGTPNDVALNNGTLYVTGGNTLYAVSPSSGTVLWKQDLAALSLSSPAPMQDRLFTISTTEKGFWLSSVDGHSLYSRFMGRGSFSKPVVEGSTLYILTNRGSLHAIDWEP